MGRKIKMSTKVDPKTLADEYVNSEATVTEIRQKYGLSTPGLYVILENYYGSREKIPLRRGRKKASAPVVVEYPDHALSKAMDINPNIYDNDVDIEALADQMLAQLVTGEKEERSDNEKMVELEFAGSTFTDPALHKLYGARTIEVDMISDRHDTGASRPCIFNGPLTPEQIVDYHWQEETVRNYIRRHCSKICSESGEDFYFERLVVICSGLQMALASVIKVCNEMKISLTLKHWNPEERRYNAQVVNTFSGDLPGSALFSRLNGEIYLYDCTIKDIEYMLKDNADFKFPSVILNDHNMKDGSFERTVYIITLNKKHMWDMYIKAVDAQLEVSTWHSVSACMMEVNKFGSLQFGDKISRGYNFISTNQRS